MERSEKFDIAVRTLLDTVSIKVKILDLPKGKVRANASVDLGIFIIKGFMVMGEEGEEYVLPPSFKRPPPAKWGKIFWSEYPDFWQELSNKILEAYKIEKSPGKSFDEIADSIEF